MSLPVNGVVEANVRQLWSCRWIRVGNDGVLLLVVRILVVIGVDVDVGVIPVVVVIVDIAVASGGDRRGRAAGNRQWRRGAPYRDAVYRFRAMPRWPAQNRLNVSRQVALVICAVLGSPQRALELVHEPAVEFVERARTAAFWRRRAGAFARRLKRVLTGT